VALSLELDTAGLWLLGVGAVLLLAERLLGQPQPRLGLTFPSAATGFTERLQFSLEGTGLLFSAVGSALFVAAHLPPIWFIAATLVVALASVYGLLAYLALKYWRLRLDHAIKSLGGDLRNPLVQWQVDCLRLCASWRWVLRHPFERDDWPKSCQRLVGPLPPGLPQDSQEVTAARLRRIEEGASLAHELAVPDSLRGIVDAADREGWRVGATGSAVAFYPTSGAEPIVVSKTDAENDVRGLHRHWLLAKLHENGLPIRSDIRGLHPANPWRTHGAEEEANPAGAD
jgi:hypothetical protein